MSAKKLFETTFLGDKPAPAVTVAPVKAKRVRKPKAPEPVVPLATPPPSPSIEEPVEEKAPPKKRQKKADPELPPMQKPVKELSSVKQKKKIVIQNDQIVSDTVPAWFPKAIEQALLKVKKETGEKVSNKEIKQAAQVQAEVKWEQPEIRKEIAKETVRHENKMAKMIFG